MRAASGEPPAPRPWVADVVDDLDRPVGLNGAPDGQAPSTRPRSADQVGRTAADNPLVLRSGTPPVDQLDFDDRHDTRATESREMGQLYAHLRKERRKDAWHCMAMDLVWLIAFLAGLVAMSRFVPQLDRWGVAAYIVGGAAGSAGRALRQRHDRRRDRAFTPT